VTKSLPVTDKLMFLGLSSLIILADQISKWWIIERYFRPRNFGAEAPAMDFIPWLTTFSQERMGPIRVEVTSFFDLVMAWNTGVSFSMFASDSHLMPYVLSGIALLMSGIFLIWLMTTNSRWTAFPLALIIAGALGNVWDRARFQAVADFLYFHVDQYGWPAFNIADSCIVVGVAFLAYDSLFLEPKRNKGYTP
jgi:signal peptidase II